MDCDSKVHGRRKPNMYHEQSDSMQMSVCEVRNFLMPKCSILDNPDLGPGVMVCCD